MLPSIQKILKLIGRPAFERRAQRSVERAGDEDDLLEVVGFIGLDHELAAFRPRASWGEANQHRQARSRSHGRRERVAGDLEGRAALILSVLAVAVLVMVLVLVRVWCTDW